MPNTAISDPGNEICLSAGEEIRIPALGDGSMKAGNVVGITDATGKVAGHDIGASEMFRGIIDKHWKIAIDTAITDGLRLSIVVPRTGKIYRIFCTDPAGAVVSGLPHKFSATAGSIEGAANTNMNTAGNNSVNNKALANGDTVGEFMWL